MAAVMVSWRPAGQEVARHVVAAGLDLALVLGGAGAAGGDQEAVVLGALAVAALDDGVVQNGLDDGRLEVVDDDLPGHAAEVLERPAVAAQPGLDLLVEHQAGELVAAAAEGHDEAPGLAQLAGLRVDLHAGGGEVDLGLLPWRGLQAHEGGRQDRARAGGRSATGRCSCRCSRGRRSGAGGWPSSRRPAGAACVITSWNGAALKGWMRQRTGRRQPSRAASRAASSGNGPSPSQPCCCGDLAGSALIVLRAVPVARLMARSVWPARRRRSNSLTSNTIRVLPAMPSSRAKGEPGRIPAVAGRNSGDSGGSPA